MLDPQFTQDSFDFIDRTQLDPGVWPQRRDLLPRHFQLIGTNRRALVVSDGGPALIEVGGVHVTDPEHLEEMAARLIALAAVLRDGRADPQVPQK